ncbi:hypothetical protein W02_35040 [Nitrospira sp. KM1]|uniref:hypothetical protein n=1 Tax=Nitrospira sp. KM1 TaxID=1936990 RepID=UPI0013A7B405|nr:hypothetical protein [Nitrospira sp. KM1]BCA56364.1 hypothetical protein W02_35040 [Nitrospira sp. KM1]
MIKYLRTRAKHRRPRWWGGWQTELSIRDYVWWCCIVGFGLFTIVGMWFMLAG